MSATEDHPFLQLLKPKVPLVVLGLIDYTGAVHGCPVYESNPLLVHGARPCNVDWIRSIVRQCKAAGVAPFVKQLGAHVIDDRANVACTVDEKECWTGACETDGNRILLRDKKGGDPSEWPEDLRVREFPEVGT